MMPVVSLAVLKTNTSEEKWASAMMYVQIAAS